MVEFLGLSCVQSQELDSILGSLPTQGILWFHEKICFQDSWFSSNTVVLLPSSSFSAYYWLFVIQKTPLVCPPHKYSTAGRGVFMDYVL